MTGNPAAAGTRPTPTVLVLNGPNLNLLGTRQPDVYGRTTLADITALCQRHGRDLGLAVEVRQSNHEGDLVEWVQEARTAHDAIVINAAAYTHTSVALYDALLAAERPAIEVHLSNIHAREDFRRHSCLTGAVRGMISGLGAHGYVLALQAVHHILAERG